MANKHKIFKQFSVRQIFLGALLGFKGRAYPSYGAHRDQRLGCTAVDLPPAFCWLPNHQAPEQAELHSQSPPDAGLFSPS